MLRPYQQKTIDEARRGYTLCRINRGYRFNPSTGQPLAPNTFAAVGVNTAELKEKGFSMAKILGISSFYSCSACRKHVGVTRIEGPTKTDRVRKWRRIQKRRLRVAAAKGWYFKGLGSRKGPKLALCPDCLYQASLNVLPSDNALAAGAICSRAVGDPLVSGRLDLVGKPRFVDVQWPLFRRRPASTEDFPPPSFTFSQTRMSLVAFDRCSRHGWHRVLEDNRRRAQKKVRELGLPRGEGPA